MRSRRRDQVMQLRAGALLLVEVAGFVDAHAALEPDCAAALTDSIAERLTFDGARLLPRTDASDHFALEVAPGSDTSAVELAARLTRELRAPFAAGSRTLGFRVSIGAAVGSATSNPADLKHQAVLALARAREIDGDRWAIFQPGMVDAARTRLDLESRLRAALAAGEFTLEYQPLVRVAAASGPASLEVTHAEALIRWRDGARGLVAPLDFIGLAEETGLIVPIGDWVLSESCRQARLWQSQLGRRGGLAVSINLSAVQLRQPELIDHVAEALRSSGADPASIVLEITESVVVADADIVISTLRSLRSLGLRIAIDDFGTGHSSLSYLTRLPLDMLKIDRTFIRGMGRGGPESAIVRAVIEMAHELDLLTVAEGVETREQLHELSTMGCDLAQGYYFSKPLGAAGISALVRANRARHMTSVARRQH